MPGTPCSLAQRAAQLAKDALYIGVGLGVLAIQRTQVQGRELWTTIDRRLRARRSDQPDPARR